jgi:hypothetical protein
MESEMKHLAIVVAVCAAATMAHAESNIPGSAGYGLTDSTPRAPLTIRDPNPEYKIGDVVEITAPGGVLCWGHNGKPGHDTLIAALKSGQYHTSECEEVGHTGGWYFEVMNKEPTTAPFNFMYCVNTVVDYPSNKTGCVWAVFPLARTRLSDKKPGPALSQEEIIRLQAQHPIKPMPEPDHRFDVQHKLSGKCSQEIMEHRATPACKAEGEAWMNELNAKFADPAWVKYFTDQVNSAIGN